MRARRQKSLGGLTLRSKILLMVLPIALLSMGVAALIAYSSSQDALTVQAQAQVAAIRNSKKSELENYFRQLRSTFSVFGGDVGVAAATQSFSDAFDALGRQKLAPERLKALEAYYRNEFVPVLNKSPGFEQVTAEQLIPHSDRTLEAQALFISENPNKPDQRDKLVDSPANNPYTLAHFTYHEWLRNLEQRFDFYDLFLISNTGTIIYSTKKETDLGTSLVDGPYANTNLGQLYRQIQSANRSGLVKLADYDFYPPSGGAPAMFIGTPIYSNFKMIGLLVGQISIDAVERTLNRNRSWRADGLGESGFVYVTGPSQLLRNNHRIFIEHPDEFLARAASQGYRPAEIDAIKRESATVLRYRMNTEGVRRAERGEQGQVQALNSQGNESLQAYAPLDIADVNWVLNANIERDEILAPLEHLKRTMLIVACALTLLCTLLAMGMAAWFVRPINALMDGIEAIKQGRTDVTIAERSDDEFGRLAHSFNEMAATVRNRDEVIASKNKAYAGLLHRVFPDVVADRLRSGEEQIIDTLPNVSLIYVSVDGFVGATDKMTGAESMQLLNEIVDRIDAVADRLGVERVKTMGEHYIAACGLTTPRLDHATRAVEFADAVAAELKLVGKGRGIELGVRASVACGRVHAGLVGNHKFVFDVWGRPLNVARRLLSEIGADEIRVTQDVLHQLGPDNSFDQRPVTTSVALGEIASFGRALRATAASAPV